MKVLKVVCISLAVLIAVIFIGLVIFLKTFDVMRFKPQIIEQANRALGRQLDFERASLGISLSQGIRLKVQNVSISEDPAFGKTDFLLVKNASMGVDVAGYLARREIRVPSIVIDSASIIVIRNKAGAMSVQTIAQSAQQPRISSASAPATVQALPALLINSLQGKNNTVIFIDQSFTPPMELRVSQLDFTVNRFSLTKAFPFTVEAAVLSDAQNIKVRGTAQLDLTTGGITVKDLETSTDLSLVNMDKVKKSFPMAAAVPLPVNLKGTIKAEVPALTAGPQGLSGLSARVSLANGLLQMKELASGLSDITATLQATQDSVDAQKVSAKIAGGTIEISGTLKDYLAKQQYDVSVNGRNINLAELLDQKSAPVQAEGLASAQMRIKGAGFTPEALKSSLSGNATVALGKGKLKNINVLRTVLDKISLIPGLAQNLEAGLPERWKEKLKQNDTALSDIELPVVIENGRMIIKDAVLSADEFIFSGMGQAGFEGDFLAEGSFVVPQDLSAAMVAKVDALQYLLNDKKQIYLPLKVSGKAGAAPAFSVDAEYIAKQLLNSQVKQQIFKALDKALGGKKEETAPAEQPQSQDQQSQEGTQEQKPSTEEAVKGILKGIFK